MTHALLTPYQNAYVTRDLEQALGSLQDDYGISSFTRYAFELPVRVGDRQGMVGIKVAFAWLGNLQYELIEPVSGLVDIYANLLPESRGLRFHHSCSRVHDWAAWRADLARRGLEVAMEGGEEGRLQFAYLDARRTLGHYLEFCAMTDETWAQLRAL